MTTMRNARQIAAGLARTGRRIDGAFRWSPKVLGRSYGEGKWTAREILGHLTDCDLVFLHRLQQMLCEDAPVIATFEQDAWAARLAYVKQDGRAMRARFGALRAQLVALALTCSVADLARTGRRPDRPHYDVRYLLEHAIEHDEHHLGQLAAIKAGRSWPAPVAG